MIDTKSLSDLLAPIFGQGPFLGYVVVFLLMFIEGPIVAYVSSFAAALGYFNVWILLVLFIFGNQIPDVLLFKLGSMLRRKNVEKFIAYFGLHKKRIAWIEKNIKNHPIKIILLIKTIPPLPPPGIILSGFMKMPFKKFFWVDLVYNFFYAILFVSLGYYSGLGAITAFKHFQIEEPFLIPIIIFSVLLIYFLIKRIYSKMAKNIPA